jgi:hypothetical protein
VRAPPKGWDRITGVSIKTAQLLALNRRLALFGESAAVSRLFISHSSANNAAAVALRDWLFEQGFENEVFLDIDPDRGLAPGQKWQEGLKAAADRCEAVLFLVSPAWLASRGAATNSTLGGCCTSAFSGSYL